MTTQAHRGLLEPGAAETVPEELRTRYLAALFLFARSDGIDPNEEAILGSVARVLGLSGGDVDVARNMSMTAQQLKVVLDAVDSRYLMRDVLRVAVADGQVQDEESAMIGKLATACGQTKEDVAAVLDWVVAERRLLARWKRLVSQP